MFCSKMFVLIVLFAGVIKSEAHEEYCDPSLCSEGLTHIACDHYLEFAQECGEDPEVISLTPTMKKLILDLHNWHRNKLSGGKLPGYAPAARMPQLHWNDDLAYVAGLHARSCTTENDSCRNTVNFKNVGQNIGYDTTGEPVHNVTAVVKRIIEAWHNEYKNGNQNHMKSLTSETIEEMGRFTMMINDKSSAIGCGMVKFVKDDLNHVYFICDYSNNPNDVDKRVYETGPSCSNCVTGCHRILTAMCGPDEKIDPNHIYVDSIRSFN